ncbi:TKL/MLK protein kinase [Saprolegnia diclina VS20]|uniref:TKL/MLK protein kinase n=1 Tax=Saprolegnia diclina (strain VS20) TaxID=1156394 RepID=T0QX61_SAPDV|nr:TKL/MLK protein kinase [Saprolegnia diclina VS20]EQC39276.1 TKL/MLK protein kinase [Saprolegnia diclina VS20]|eukprot:XP_008607337.1 TKL/MLK protein kinase [Saprolegnia diclina VS20]
MGLRHSAPCWSDAAEPDVEKDIDTDVLPLSPLYASDGSIDCAKLQMLETIGHDAHGRVDRALYKSKPVTVRTINNVPRPTYLASMRKAYSLRSPYTVAVHGIIDANPDRPKIVTECVDGYRLSQYLAYRSAGRPTGLNPSTLDIALAVAMGLDMIHEHGLVHGQLHPNKIYVTSNEEIKLSDFGGSLYHEDPTFSRMYFEGEPYYWAPELYEDYRNETPAADMYAFGVILCYLDTGVPPFGPDDRCRNSLLMDIVDNALRPALRPDCPDWYRSLAHQCMAKEPADRPSAADVVDLLIRHNGDVAFLDDGLFQPYYAPYPWLRKSR